MNTILAYSIDYFPPDFPLGLKPVPIKQLIKWTSDTPSWDPAFIIDEGDILKIVKVTNEENATLGDCWHVFATVDKNPFLEFELPSCWMHFTVNTASSNLWFQPTSAYKLSIDKNRDKINLVSNYIKLTQCPAN